MRTARSFLIGLLLLSLALAPLPVFAQGGFSSTGGTQVSVEGSLVTITVSIDFALGGVGATTVQEGAQAAADGLAQEIANYWNQGFERLSSACVQFKLVVKINVVPQGDAHLRILSENPLRGTWITTPGRHVVFWGVNNFGNAAPPETYDEYDEDGIAPPGEDYGAPLEHELWSIWSPHLENARGFAHELGHLMGFGDDYANGEPLPGREGTLMDDGDLIDQNLVNRLADLARDSGKQLPECWEGTANSTITTQYPGQCGTPTTTQATVRLVVGEDGSVTGTLDATGCGVSSPHGEFTGTVTDAGFLFPQLVVFTNGSLIPKVSPTHAEATLTNIQGGATWVTTWDLECKSCEE